MTLGTDISKKDTDKDVLLFRYQNPLPAECEWASIEFSGHDIIRFIDCKFSSSSITMKCTQSISSPV